ncbi:MAG: fibronectin type III domain-containing protein, partial [Acidiferrobacterales bacterium]|nr:fibronectin type III domain-containing protein [Acidiferrobacterales bacterium]
VAVTESTDVAAVSTVAVTESTDVAAVSTVAVTESTDVAAVSTQESAETAEPVTQTAAVVAEASSASDADSPEFLSIEIDSTTTTTAVVRWALSENATGQIEYGLTTDYGNFSKRESRLIYSEHVQPLTGLEPNTEYNFRLIAVDADGNETISDNNIFTTDEQQVGAASEQLPQGNWVSASTSSFYDESQPMAGMFVGIPNGGVYGAANTANANHHSVRFRAPRTGVISSVMFQNRLSAVSSVFTRAASQPKYQACQDYWAAQGVPFVNEETPEQLRKAAKCAYHIGNYYSAGNGGSIIFEIRPDLDGFPNMDVAPLGKTNTPFVPIENTPQFFINHPLDVVANVSAGAFYHIVLRNMTPVVGATSNLPVAAAFAMPDNTGALSLNGVQFPKGVDVAGQQGPYFGGHRTLRSADQNSDPRNWVNDPDTMSWWGATYSTGELIGFTAAAYDSLSVDSGSGKSGSMYIHGSRYARQAIDATHNTTVDGVWVHHGHSSSANGQPMSVKLKQGNTTLATASIPHNSAVRSAVAGAGSDLFTLTSAVWSYQPLSVEVDLTQGTTYHLEFSAPQGAAFRLYSMINSFGGSYPQLPDSIPQNGRAQRSDNSGATWSQFAGATATSGTDRVLQTLLTVKGMPRKLTE